MDKNGYITYWDDDLFIKRIEMECICEQLYVTMFLRGANKLIRFRFINVSGVFFSELSASAIIGFRVVDNTFRGWDRALRYKVEDYENDQIRFYCEDFEYSEELIP